MQCPFELKKAYREGRVIPFIGAGVSMSVEWEENGQKKRGPSWSELVERATDLMGFETIDLARVRGTDLQILEYFKCKNSGQTAKLTNWLNKLMTPPDESLIESKIHEQLAKLDKCSIFYTTNYDDFIEKSFELFDRKSTVVAVESQMGSNHDCEIVKFHGDLNHPDQIVLTELQYEERLSLSTAMDFKLRADLLGRVIVFIGYSFRDPNISYLFGLFTKNIINKIGSRTGTRAYIATPNPTDFEIELFKARKIEVISIDGFNQAADIADLLLEMRG